MQFEKRVIDGLILPLIVCIVGGVLLIVIAGAFAKCGTESDVLDPSNTAIPEPGSLPSPSPTFTITFYENDALHTTTSSETNDSGNLSSLPNPIRANHIFDGWFKSDGTKVTTFTVFTDNTTVFAKWTYVPPPSPSPPPEPILVTVTRGIPQDFLSGRVRIHVRSIQLGHNGIFYYNMPSGDITIDGNLKSFHDASEGFTFSTSSFSVQLQNTSMSTVEFRITQY
jgi:uncharacterized repeat protein (TIGR02543 family)